MYQIGDKVVAISKSTGWNFEVCTSIKMAKKKGQKFLYVNEIRDNGLIVCAEHNYTGGDYFLECDLIPYDEEIKKIDILSTTTFKVKDIVDLLNKKILLEDDEVTISRVSDR